MRSKSLLGGALLVGALVAFGPSLAAAAADTDAGVSKDASAPKGDAGKPDASPGDAGAAATSPHTEDPHGGDPHGHGAGAQGGGTTDENGIFQPPPDTAEPDATLPAGTIRILVRDPDGKPLPGTVVTIGIINNSVAKGESRKRVECTADGAGECTLKDQDRGQLVAYRISVNKEGAQFAVPPFQLAGERGVRATLHVYPVVSDLAQATIVTQAIVYAEMKDDRVQIEEILSIYNFGKTAWVPKDLVLDLPPEFTALTAQQEMSDVTVESVDKRGARIKGTLGPGRHDVEFRWQLPYSGDKDVSLFTGLPPHVAAGRVMAPAASQMKLVVDGFPAAVPRTDNRGQRMLVTERELRRDEAALTRISIELRDLPTVGPARWVVTGLAGLVVLGAIAFGFGVSAPSAGSSAKDRARARRELLDELTDLERSRLVGDVGPKTYERARRVLLERLAGLLRDDPKASPKAS